MKNNLDHKYSEITSFEDIRKEKELLRLRSRITETRLNLTYVEIRRAFSFSNLLVSAAREVLLPKISDFLGVMTKKETEDAGSGTENKKVKRPRKRKTQKPREKSGTRVKG